jgi:uncharacterized protein YodC (DUF2158 family)
MRADNNKDGGKDRAGGFMEFKPRDVVKLKSGGPEMTVDEIRSVGSESIVHCVWFDDKHQDRDGTFSPVSLELVKGE